MASIKEVAKLAGVAKSTVSLVLNRKGYVSEETRAKVEEAIKALEYVPNEVARNLSLSRTNIIGFILPDINHPFFAELIRETEIALYDLGYQIMICSTTRKDNAERNFIEMLKRHSLDGLIMGAHTMDLEIYKDLSQPIIAFDRYVQDNIPVFHADHAQGGKIAADAFLKHSCKHIIQAVGSPTVQSPANLHEQVFYQILKDAGIQVDCIELPWNAFSKEIYYSEAKRLFETYPDVDGIFGSDLFVASCLSIAYSKGVRIPDDLKLVAYDGTYITRIGIPMITAVVQPIRELAENMSTAIVNLVNGKPCENIQPLQMKLQQGQTC